MTNRQLTPTQLQRLAACATPGTLREIVARLGSDLRRDALRSTLDALRRRNLVAVHRSTPTGQPHIYEVSALGDELLRGLGR